MTAPFPLPVGNPSAPTLRTRPARLVDAFVDVVAPVFARRASDGRLVVVDDGDAFVLHHVARGSATPLGRSDALSADATRRVDALKGGAVELRLRPDKVLARTVRLPAAGRDYFEAILRHRLDRLTPWQPDDVLFGFSVEAGPDAQGQVPVAFAATSTAIADEALRRLQSAGLTPTAIGAAGPGIADPLPVDLTLGRRNPARRRLRRAIALAGIAMLAVLLPAAAASFVWLAQARGAANDVEDRFADVRRALIARAGAGTERDRALALLDAKTPGNAVVVLVDRLADRLPDGTYLTAIEVDPERVRLTGVSADAPALIARLEDSAVLADVRFAAPVVRDSEGRDVFDILARRLRPEAGR